jgi:hypothetical protein
MFESVATSTPLNATPRFLPRYVMSIAPRTYRNRFPKETNMARAQATTDHQVIRRWIETRKGHPSVVGATHTRQKGSTGLLRVDFNEPEDTLEGISWDEFFDTFDSNNLAFLFQDEKQSRFHKFVNRDSIDEDDEGSSSAKSKSASGASNKAGGKTRQTSPQEEDEAEEIDEEDLEDEEDDEDLDEDEDEDEADEDDDDLDDDDDDDDDDEDEEDEGEKPSRGRKR